MSSDPHHQPEEEFAGREDTLLDVFLAFATNPATAERDVVLCAESTWSYSELDIISTSVALEVKERYGCGSESPPTVAVISENHPYTLVLFLAIWKLGGIVASLDQHAPPELMKSMLQNVAPTFVVLTKDDVNNRKTVQDLDLPIEYIEPDQHTIPSLTQRFLHLSPDQFNLTEQPPKAQDIALFIYTSSASSVHNLKCVPVSHGSLVTNGRAQLSWFQNNIPGVALEQLNVLGWSPFSHIMSVCFDFGTNVLLTGGCYIFGITPSAYTSSDPDAPAARDQRHTVATQLLSSILRYQPDVFAGVPWVFDSLIAAANAEISGNLPHQAKIAEALSKLQYIISAGAATSVENIAWAKQHNIPLLISIGMTELGGVLFHSHISQFSSGWDVRGSCISDARFTLIDENGDISKTEGELYVTSKHLTRGYLNLKTESFSEDPSTGDITFKTGDIYTHPGADPSRLIWQGRKDDFIQLKSGESLDPRNIEKTLSACPIVAHSCIIGNTFLSGAADFVCALIELTQDGQQDIPQSKAKVSKILSSINRNLVPPLRIAWPRVLFLEADQHIPYTRKHMIFRKKLQELFGHQLLTHLTTDSHVDTSGKRRATVKSRTRSSSATFSKEDVAETVFRVVSRALGVTEEILDANLQSTFAELGMDSAMATIIVNNLNQRLSLSLPPNTCHNYVDLKSLTGHVYERLESNSDTSIASSSLSPPPLKSSSGLEPIAVVGYALRLPGDINDSEALWRALVEKRKDVLTPTPADRWDHASFQDDPSCRITFEKSGFIDVAHFDNTFFGIPAAEALSVSPVTRLALETAFEALERANIPLSKVKGTDMGVFVAAGLDPGYGELLFHDKGYDSYNRFYGTGNATSTACGRLSYLLDVHGPSMTVETACSGSFVALDQAVRHLQSGRGESAIVCGVNTHTLPGMFGFLSAQKMTSPQSRCATFSNEADGYASSEGVVSVIVKTQSAALRDGDTILGIIKATDTMHNGKTQGLAAPSLHAQILLQRSLLRLSNLMPADIDVVETHGTGTSLGDLIEIQGINEVFGDSHTPSRPLIIGAAKSCIGHTETASGLVGLVKTLSSFEKNAVPGVTHLNEANLNPAIDCSIIPMHIPCYTVNLKKRQAHSYKALVVSYGFAGTISGAVVEAPPQASAAIPCSNVCSPMLFVVSAKTQAALLAYVQLYLDFCTNSPSPSFRSICYTSCVGREHYQHRFACAVTDMQHLISKLRERLSQGTRASNPPNPRVIFGFPGQGSQFRGMAKDLASRFSGFQEILTDYASLAASLSGYPLLSLLLDDEDCGVDIDESQIAQVCIFVYQAAVAKWLETLGIEAHAVVGHSLGEIAAAVSAGSFEFSDGLKFVIARADALKASASCPGTMAAIAAPEATIQEYIEALGLQGHVVVGVYNGVESHVVSGFADAVDALYATVKADGIRCVKLKVDQGFHSPCITNGLPALQTWLEEHESILKPLQVPFYSTAIAEKISPKQYLRPGYWVDHARNPVRLLQTVNRIRSDKAINVFLDVGPQPTLWTAIQNQNVSEKVLLATTAKAGKDQEMAFLDSLARLFENRVYVNLHKLCEEHSEKFSKTAIPTYPYQRQRFYPDFVPSRNQKSHGESAKASIELLSVDHPLLDLLHDHRIEKRRVFPGVAFGDVLARLNSNKHRYVQHVRFHQPLVLENTGKLVRIFHGSDGSFNVFQNGSKEDADRLCSGTLSPAPLTCSRMLVDEDAPPLRTLRHEEIYLPFEGNIHFGPAFRNVKHLSIWSDHIDAQIHVPPSLNSNLDRIRKLDPCLHVVGALLSVVNIPEPMRHEGFYLPTSLEGFSLHTDELPSSIICRYFLPFEVSSNYRSISMSLEAFSPSGELLMSCRKYSVAWLPKGVAIQTPVPVVSPRQWMRNTWRQEDVLIKHRAPKHPTKDETVLYVSDVMHTDVLAPFADNASEILFVELNASERRMRRLEASRLEETAHLPDFLDISILADALSGKDVVIVLEASSRPNPESLEFSAFWKHILWLMKLTLNNKICVSSFVVVSCQSAPTDTSISPTASPSLGAIVQGLLRVYRRESGLQRCVVWGLDLPDALTPSAMFEIITQEIELHREIGESSHSITAYRRKSTTVDSSVIRLVPVLLPVDNVSESLSIKPAGITVIVGMGSIGSTLGSHLAVAKCKPIIFMGRKDPTDPTVVADLEGLQSRFPGTFEYMQVDATDLPSVRRSLNEVKTRFGSVNNIVYTAGVVNDAMISVATEEEFERVLNSKVQGAWNMHLMSQELHLNLDAFVLLSSISVVLGNPGQAAYVAANSFLDSLAGYRQTIGLNGTSLQLGAWESRLINVVDLSHTALFAMSHDEGMPLMMKAMMSRDPVQVIAKIDLKRLRQLPTLASDPIYRELLVNDISEDRTPSSTPGIHSKGEAKEKIINVLKSLLMLKAEDELELEQSLTSFGIDSISFAQARGQVLQTVGLDIPMIYLSDSFSVDDMISAVCKGLKD